MILNVLMRFCNNTPFYERTSKLQMNNRRLLLCSSKIVDYIISNPEVRPINHKLLEIRPYENISCHGTSPQFQKAQGGHS